MSAAARLWDRAPLWRASAVLAVSATTLGLLYPPGHAQAPRVTSRFIPLTAADVLGPPFRALFPLPERQIPLPTGDWHPVTKLVRNGKPLFESTILVRMAGNRPSGFVIVQETVPHTDDGRVMQMGYRCASVTDLAADLIAPRDHVRQECWNVRARFLPQDWTEAAAASIYQHGVARLREGGIQVEGTFVGANWFQADTLGVVLVDYFFPPGARPGVPDSPAAWSKAAALADPQTMDYLRRLQAWALAWTGLLESGADGRLQVDAVQSVSATNPF